MDVRACTIDDANLSCNVISQGISGLVLTPAKLTEHHRPSWFILQYTAIHSVLWRQRSVRTSTVSFHLWDLVDILGLLANQAICFRDCPEGISRQTPSWLSYVDHLIIQAIIGSRRDIAFGCKRMILDTDYLAALHRPNLSPTWDGIASITENGIITKKG